MGMALRYGDLLDMVLIDMSGDCEYTIQLVSLDRLLASRNISACGRLLISLDITRKYLIAVKRTQIRKSRELEAAQSEEITMIPS